MGRRNFLNKFNPRTTPSTQNAVPRRKADRRELEGKKNHDVENDTYTGCLVLRKLLFGFWSRVDFSKKL